MNEQSEVFWHTLHALENDKRIQLLRQYPQHRVSNTLQHSHNVAVFAYVLSVRWRWHIDARALVVGAMLHDYYLYDIKKSGLSDYQHGIRHPQTALTNAKRQFALDEKEQNIISSHMWPLTLFQRPKSREAVLVCVADKYCAFQEMYRGIVHIEDVLKK